MTTFTCFLLAALLLPATWTQQRSCCGPPRAASNVPAAGAATAGRSSGSRIGSDAAAPRFGVVIERIDA
jgi:hypothetical protein